MSTSLKALTAAKIEQVRSIAEKSFGSNFITALELRSYIKNPKKKCYVSLTNGVVSGFLLVSVNSAEELKEVAHSELSWFVDRYSKHNTIGLIKTIAVDQNHKKAGIGTRLAEKCIFLLSKKVNRIIAFCWEQDGSKSNFFLLEKCGMKGVRKITNFWEEDSFAKNYNCKVCGPPPCLCSAYLYEI